jgi:hypothetical protein
MSNEGGPGQSGFAIEDLAGKPKVRVWLKPNGSFTVDDPGNERVNWWEFTVMDR